MKHIHKYIFATIIALLLTSTLQSAPKAFDSLGNELEALQKDCKQYLKDPKISKKLKATCKKFNAKVNKAFKVGYPLDASVESDTANEKKVARYLALLRKADESGKSLRELKRSRKKKERKQKEEKYTEKYRKACDAGDAKKCYELGVIFYEGEKIEKNYKEAARFYSKACNGGDSRACSSLGEMYYWGSVIKKNYAKAFILFSKACDANYAKGCTALGYMWGHGNSVKKDKVKAYKFTSKACAGGDAIGCYNLGNMYAEGLGVKQDDVKAEEFYGKACAAGNADGCKRYSILKKKNVKKGTFRGKTKAPKLVAREWGKRSAYYDNETSYIIGQVCLYRGQRVNYKGTYDVTLKQDPWVASALINREASKKAGSIKYNISCTMSKKDGKLIRKDRLTNKVVSKYEILKAVQDECEFYPENECRSE